jgi:hypothetical protein
MITSSTRCPLQDGNIQEKQSPLTDSENINHTISSRGTMPTPHKANKAHKQKTKHKNYDPPPTDSSKLALAT